jgi:hypothetical protein
MVLIPLRVMTPQAQYLVRLSDEERAACQVVIKKLKGAKKIA